jgi:hypothetical protein
LPQNQGYYGLDFGQSIDKWGVAYLPKGYMLFGTTNMPVFKRKTLARLGLMKKSIVPFGLTLPTLNTPTNANNCRMLILQYLLMGASSWHEYAIVLVVTAQIAVQAYIRQVYRTLYARSIVSKKGKARQKNAYSNIQYKTFSKFLEPLDEDERAGVAGLDADIINKLFKGHKENFPEASEWSDVINITRMRPTNANSDGSFKELINSSLYIHALRPVFDPRLEWPGAPRWQGFTEKTTKPVWPQNEFRVFLDEIWHLVDSIEPPADCFPDGANHKQYDEFEKAGGFLMLICIQAAKTLWIILAYEKQDWSSIKKPDNSSSRETNALIKNTPQMKRTKFWAMAPPVEAIRFMTNIKTARHPNWHFTWSKPMQLSRDLHDSIYISLLNDSTNLNIPQSLTVKTSTRHHENNNFLVRLPMGLSISERRSLFFWRSLDMAKAMDQVIREWSEDISDMHDDLDDYDETRDAASDDDEGEEDDDDDDNGNDTPLATAEKWTSKFIQIVNESRDEVVKWHLNHGNRRDALAASQNQPRRTTWAEEGLANANGGLRQVLLPPKQDTYTHFRSKDPTGAIRCLPIALVPGVDLATPQHYLHQIAKVKLQYPSVGESRWGDTLAELYLACTFYMVGGPTDLVRKRGELMILDRKGFRFPVIRDEKYY